MKTGKNCRTVLLLPLLVLVTQLCAAADFRQDYQALLREGKFGDLQKLLKKWEKAEPENPELYIAWFNYYVNRDVKSSVNMTGKQGQYNVSPGSEYNAQDVREGMKYLDKGFELAPNRLDMYWGKIEVYFASGLQKPAIDTISTVLEKSKAADTHWVLGTKPVDVEYVLEYVNRYYDKLLESGTGLTNLKRLAELQISLYPESVFAYNYLAVHYMMMQRPAEALRCFLEAEKVAPSDCIVLINVGRVYSEMKDKEKAKEYFNKVLSIGNTKEKNMARSYLDRL